MSIGESLLVALVCITLVVTALACLYVLILVFSRLFGAFSKKVSSVEANNNVLQHKAVPEEEFSTGNLVLKNVDEKTAAMIMAIVSDESGIPLSELCFKSIKLIEK